MFSKNLSDQLVFRISVDYGNHLVENIHWPDKAMSTYPCSMFSTIYWYFFSFSRSAAATRTCSSVFSSYSLALCGNRSRISVAIRGIDPNAPAASPVPSGFTELPNPQEIRKRVPLYMILRISQCEFFYFFGAHFREGIPRKPRGQSDLSAACFPFSHEDSIEETDRQTINSSDSIRRANRQREKIIFAFLLQTSTNQPKLSLPIILNINIADLVDAAERFGLTAGGVVFLFEPYDVSRFHGGIGCYTQGNRKIAIRLAKSTFC